MNVLYSCDENYARICGVSVQSLLENNAEVKDIKIYIVDNKINDESKKKIQDIVKKHNQELQFIDIKTLCSEKIKDNDFPISAYARLFVQDMDSIDKILYIDCDTIINNNIEELWNIDISQYYVAGVEDLIPRYLKKAIGMLNADRYINSGVLIINLKKWREINFSKLVIDFIEEHNKKVVHHDQGIINGLCKSNILYLHPKFNLMPEYIAMKYNELMKLYNMKNFYTEQEVREAIDKPSIIHFISKFYNRPWYKDCTNPFNHLYIKYLNETEFDKNLPKKELDKRKLLRKKIYEKFPFTAYMIMERIFDVKRKIKL